MSNLSDYLLLAGIALCVISVIAAIVQLLQTEPPRGAVITLLLGIVLTFAGAYTAPKPFHPQDILSAWARVTGGEAADGAAGGGTAEEGEAAAEGEAPAN
ncbi:hypothetical protein [Paracoccus alkanivorans]|uniref:Uncharacterized protein n=1 Tax=Paracoccus alkanivorans TaxID=2116655 RepID=A0A3M0MET6_9RHOB|nr:hypothetical protein [Paracoccus alkanivorans]RMC36161.1 hypothetical protein C9E81_05525 [Paracoccus alkanivorans]